MMDAIILAGGLGTRLAATLPGLPKALAPIRGTPFLHFLIQQLEKAIVSRIVLALGHQASQIEHFLQKRSYSVPLVCSVETTPLGTGGAILHALPHTQTPTLLILNGDSYFDIDFTTFIAAHKTTHAALTIACLEIEDVSRYGSIELDAAGRIIRFQEKSTLPRKGWINGGIYLAEREIFDVFPHVPCSLETDLLPRMNPLYAHPHTGTFIDIGTRDSYYASQELLGKP